jgi:hypothetical protein
MPIQDGRTKVADLPDCVRDAFRQEALLPTKTVAKLLGLHPSGLLAIVHQHNLPSHSKGLGRVRPRRTFSIDEVCRIWHYMSANRH